MDIPTETHIGSDYKIIIEYRNTRNQDKVSKYFKDGYFDNLIETRKGDECYISNSDGLTHYYFKFDATIIRYIDDIANNDSVKYNYTSAQKYAHLLTLQSIGQYKLDKPLTHGDLIMNIGGQYYYRTGGRYYLVKNKQIKSIETNRATILNITPKLSPII